MTLPKETKQPQNGTPTQQQSGTTNPQQNKLQKITDAMNTGKIYLIDYANKPVQDLFDINGEKVSVYKNHLTIRLYLVTIDKIDSSKIFRGERLANGTVSTFQASSPEDLEKKIKDGLSSLIGKYKTGNGNIKESKEDVLESIKLEYTYSAVNESMTAVKLVRNAVFESNKNAYLVSMTGWGDGSRHNPAKFLEESVKSVIYSATSYSDIAKAAKKDKNLNILPLTESTTYQVPMPYNRYAILTNGNPLYEAVAVITIDATPDHNITSSKFIGVTRIVK